MHAGILWPGTWPYSDNSRCIMKGDPKLDASQRVPDVSHHRLAELIGLKGILTDRPGKLGAGLGEARAAERSVAIEVNTDPQFPYFRSQVTFEQVRNITASLLKGGPQDAVVVSAGRLVRATVKRWMHEGRAKSTTRA